MRKLAPYENFLLYGKRTLLNTIVIVLGRQRSNISVKRAFNYSNEEGWVSLVCVLDKTVTHDRSTE